MKKTYKSTIASAVFALSTVVAMGQQLQEKVSVKSSSGFIKVDPVKGEILTGKAAFQNSMQLSEQNDFQLKSQKTDELGFNHIRYQQTYQGVPVEFAVPVVHSKNGITQTITGEFYDIKDLSVAPGISSETAFAKAVQHTGAQSYLWEDQAASQELGYEQPQGELLILPLFEGDEVVAKLAYKFTIYTIVPLGGGDLYIDAQNGDALFFNNKVRHVDNFGHDGRAFNTISSDTPCTEEVVDTFEDFVTGTAATRYSGSRSIETTFSGGSYTLNDAGRSVFTRDANNLAPVGNSLPYITNYSEFTDNDNNWTAAEYDNANKDNAALDAHWGAMETYDYWLQVHNRDSYNGSGAQLRSYVHVDSNYDNAFWFLNVMSYGDGSSNGNEGNGFFDALTSLDVASHEIGHAVTEFTANLAYQRESGGLNEGYSDIWGAAVEHFAKGNGNDAAPDPSIWLIGDEIDRRNGSAALRSMSDPKSLGQPDTYGGSFWQNPNCGTPTQNNDYCGVHTNSGVLNHWFYLTVAGGSGSNDVGDSYNVAGIGMNKAAQIAYRGINQYMSANTTYAQARTALIQSAVDLYGAGGIEEETVTNAMYAVNVGDAFGGGNPGGGNYCSSQGNNVNDEYISRVQIGSIDNTSGSGNGYTDHTNISTNLSKGDNVTITITPTWTGTVYAEGYSVWIDYNQNGSFDDSGEQVFTQAATTTTPVSGSFTVPTSSTDGDTRMRVSLKYNGIPTSCETFTYGEVEDYTVTIGGSTADTQAPSVPANLSASNITETTVDLSWNASNDNVGVTGYDVYQGTSLLGTVTGTGANITGLTAATSYTFSVRAKDAAGNVSASSNTVNVTTDSGSTADTQAPSVPANLSAFNITETTADLSWNASSDNVGVTGYDVYMDGSLLGTVTGTGANITGLVADTSYSFSVRAKDAAGNVSGASNTVNITTAGGSGGPVDDLLLGSYFETGLDGWLDGGSDCFRYSGSRSPEGSFSMRLRDNSGTASAMTTASSYDLTAYDNVSISFSFYPNSMENNEDFWVRYNDGSGWQTVATYARGTDFNNGTVYTATVNLSSAAFNLSANGSFRIQCDASGNGDQVYIDEVEIRGTAGGASIVPNSLIDTRVTLNEGPQGFGRSDSELEGDFQIFPNPAVSYTDIRLAIDIEDIAIDVNLDVYDALGRRVLSNSYKEMTNEQFSERLDVSQLKTGVYFVKISASNGMLETHKFIKR